jgi:hypothetical protein
MNRFSRQTTYSPHPAPVKGAEPLSEQRYADLLRSASNFFASAVEVTDDERKVKISEIKELLNRHKLTVEDLQ